MKKRTIVLVGGAFLAVVVSGAIVYRLTRPVETATTLASGTTYAKAKRMLVTGECLATNSALSLSSAERSHVEQVAMSHLYDVPAGTNVDIVIASYSKDEVTGSDRYPDKFGHYNFTLNRRADGDWKFTTFTHCS